MSRSCRLFLSMAFTVGIALFVGSPSDVNAQAVGGNVGGGNVQGGNVQGGNVQGGGGQGNQQAAGIHIDAKGVVQPVFVSRKSVALSRKRMDAIAKKLLSGDVNRPSKLRKVSLVRLEAACEDYVKQGKPAPPDMQFLAGVQRIDYLFVDLDGKDIVIAGPAEGYANDSSGRVVGLTSGRPPLRLDDLIVALRVLQRNQMIGCSIDPDQGRLASLQQYIKTNSSTTSTGIAQKRYRRMRNILGKQNVRLWGVAGETHFAEAMVEADYRMKLIALGLERPPVRSLTSHLQMVGSGGNSMQRWWFTPLYDAFNTTEDRDAFQFAGPRAQLMSQEEKVGPQGQRSDAPFTRISTQRFGKLFTAKFPELAARSPIFAELQNLIDLAVLAALLKKEQLPQKVDWKMSLFLDSAKAKTQLGNAPREVPSAVNYKKARRGMIVGLVGGGVTINADATVRAIEFKVDPAVRLGGLRTSALKNNSSETHPWWWD
ncbi:MAG: DUF1598 domain-containing protein [Planctomycetaceae bacterium]|jgi:hypothetical protein|nr:DUF1598 domain-containing protein [Planctomycetaceae bacterium]MBT6487364.1 DUF1598 domain-containing protein [Planctomycetaceae bacterium]MBT6494420.1 DUF1598 domain-containing protein [Planctomycetaceae bacterium]